MQTCHHCNETLVRPSRIAGVCGFCYQDHDMGRHTPVTRVPRGVSDIIGMVVCFDLSTGAYKYHKAVRRES